MLNGRFLQSNKSVKIIFTRVTQAFASISVLAQILQQGIFIQGSNAAPLTPFCLGFYGYGVTGAWWRFQAKDGC